jgi:alpha-D-ribose 1-methylphosphonate 5-triphosphate diphosphatase
MHTTNQTQSSPLAGITGRRVLGAGGVGPAMLGFRDGNIAQQAPGAGPCIDVGDLLVLLGIVDIHGDAFERAVMGADSLAA